MENKKYLIYAKYLIILSIVISILILLFYNITSNGSENPTVVILAKYYPYIASLAGFAFNVAILFLVLYLINREK